MSSHARAPIVLAVATICTWVAVGAPTHGHAPHDDRDGPRVERGHHDHQAGYVQGDARLLQRGPRLAPAPPALPPAIPVVPVETRFETPDPRPSLGRAPPASSSPRAPPA